ncbi:MAG: TIGR03013 family XrtA/PEP-CTERM system glycosyltransferase [Planctomycetota bacterium]
MKVAGVRVRGVTLVYVLLEDLLILAVLMGAFAFAHFGRLAILRSPLNLVNAVVLLIGLKAVFFWVGLYDFRHVVDRLTFWKRLLGGVALVSVAAAVLWCLLADQVLVYGSFVLAFVPVIILGRLAFEVVSRARRFRKRLLFMGIGPEAQRTAREILDLCSRDYVIVGFLAERRDEMGWRLGGRGVLGTYGDLEPVVAVQKVDKVVVAVPDRRKQLPLGELLRVRLRGVEIVEEARVHEEIAGKIPVDDLRPSWLIFSEGFSNTRLRNVTKRGFDITVALIGLILSAPLSLLTALAIRLTSRGPVIFQQQRVGQGGREFTLYKFRSMRVDAEACGTPQWAAKEDPRVTRVGRFIRATRLDEIPQMWNVLQGRMSFVGPRPERPYFVAQLRKKIPYYDQRHALKPGITGWAQVRFRYGSDETDATEKLRHDMFYVKYHSILFDLRILLETVRVVFDREKAR